MVPASGRAETVRDRHGRCSSAATIIELNAPAGTARIFLAGEIDTANADTILAHVTAALRQRPRSVTLDMSGVGFIDSSGLGAMVTARNRCLAAGAGLTVVNPSRAVLRILAQTGLDKVFTPEASTEPITALTIEVPIATRSAKGQGKR